MARWILEDVDEEKVHRLLKEFDVPRLAVEILLRRGIPPSQIHSFLFPDESFVHDPYSMKDMEKAVDVLMRAWKEKRPVLIHGDYDVDGVTGAALLFTFMKSMGWKVDVYIPDRINEGYGVSSNAVEEFHRRGGKVLLTVDCGITAFESVNLAKRLGMDVVITDHHEVLSEIPRADAVVDPHRPDDEYPFKDLAGVGVAFKLVQALADRFGMEFEDLEGYLDLVALGTVADMVPLLDENRLYVKRGLKLIGKVKERPGLRYLVEKLMLKEVRSKDISYKIAPRLNAAGRMGSAFDAFKLLVMREEDEAEHMVKTLINHNSLRQEIETSIFQEAIRTIEDMGLDRMPVIMVGGENWHLGVIGIVASRIANRYGKPAMVISFNNGLGKGSARSVDGTNILDIFQRFSDTFIEYGGHAMAVGFTISRKSYEELKERIEDLEIERREEDIRIDAEISLRDINPELFDVLRILEPFGLGNPEPLFLIRDLEISKLSFFDNGRSASLVLRKGGSSIGALWNSIDQDEIVMIRQGALKMDVVAEIDPDFFNPKIRLVDTKFKSGIDEIDSMLYMPRIRRDQRDQEREMMEKRVSELLWDDPWGKIVVSDLRSRNYLIMEMLKRNAVVLSLNDIISRHVYLSILRHGDQDESRFMGISRFLESPPEDVDGIVLNELQLLFAFREHPKVRRALEILKNYRTMGLMTKAPRGMKAFLKEMRFKKLRKLKLRRMEFRIQDFRGREYRPSTKVFSVILEDPHEYGEIEGHVYHHDLNRFQRISVVNLVKRRKTTRLKLSPNTDGLTVLLGGEVIYRANPKTAYELLDAVYPISDHETPVLTLNYDTEPDYEFEDELDRVYFERFTRRLYDSPAREIIHLLQDPEELI